MRKTSISFVLGALFLAVCFSAEAQQTKRVFRIGYLASSSPDADSARSQAIRLALRKLGYIEGQNVAYEFRYAQGKVERDPELAAELVRLKVDVILAAGGDTEILAAKNASKTTPVVMTGSGSDPVESGIVASLAHPGGNVTGLTNLIERLSGKRLELLKEAVAKINSVAIPHVPTSRTHGLELKEIDTAAGALGVTIQRLQVHSAKDLDTVFATMRKQRPDGIQVLGGTLLRDNRQRIIDFALKSRLPTVFTTTAAVAAGGLMYYGPDVADSYRQVAWYVDKILQGSKPADLPVQQPTKFELLINLKTAKQIGVNISPNLLVRANRVIR